MVYISSDGSVKKSKSWLRLSIITDIFFGVANFAWLFISSLLYPSKTLPKLKRNNTSSTTSNNSSGGSGGNGGGGSNRPRGPNIHQLKPSNNNCSAAGS